MLKKEKPFDTGERQKAGEFLKRLCENFLTNRQFTLVLIRAD